LEKKKNKKILMTTIARRCVAYEKRTKNIKCQALNRFLVVDHSRVAGCLANFAGSIFDLPEMEKPRIQGTARNIP
jgi:hypothetical protein